MIQSVYISAVGLRCAVGLTVESAAAAVRAGISRIEEHSFLTDSTGRKLSCARDPGIGIEVLGVQRMIALARGALYPLDAALSRCKPPCSEIPMLLALPELRPGFTAKDAAVVERSVAATPLGSISVTSVRTAGSGHAGAISALQQAFECVSSGEYDIILVGGVDSYLHKETLNWLDAGRRLAREGVRGGFNPGEGAVFLALASIRALERYKLASHGRLRAVACTHEPRPFDGDVGLLGEALSEAVSRATNCLLPPHDQISDVYGDINGERPRTEDWGFSLMRSRAQFRDATAYVTAAGQCGDVGAATGALGCVLATQAWRRRYARGPRALVWAGSWGGLRGVALLEDV